MLACWQRVVGGGHSLLSTRQQNLPDGLPAAPAPQSSSTPAPAAGCTACATPSSPSRRPRRRAAWAHRTSSSTPPSQTRCALPFAWADVSGLPRAVRCCRSPALQLGLPPAASLLQVAIPRCPVRFPVSAPTATSHSTPPWPPPVAPSAVCGGAPHPALCAGPGRPAQGDGGQPPPRAPGGDADGR